MGKEIRGIDIDEVIQGVNLHNEKKVKRLREYINKRREQVKLDYSIVYIDLLFKIDEIFGREKLKKSSFQKEIEADVKRLNEIYDKILGIDKKVFE